MNLDEIEKHIDTISIKKPKHHKRKYTRFLGRIIPIKILAVLVCTLMVSGALITLLWYTHVFNLQGDIELNGLDQPETGLFYDSTQLLNTATTTITTLDDDSITAGDDLVFSHTWENDRLDGQDYKIVYNYDNMPLEYTDTEDEFYGFEFYVEDVSDTETLTYYVCDGDPATTVKYHYLLDELFEDTLNDFPFYLEADVERGELIELDPIFRYNMNEGTGTTVTDATGNGHTGTITGTFSWTTGKIDGGLNFQDTGKIVVPSVGNWDSDQPFSFSAWVNPETLTADGQLVGKYSFTTSTGYLFKWGIDNKIRVQIGADSTYYLDVKTTNAFSTNSWHLIEICYDGSTSGTGVAIFVDGAEQTTTIAHDTLSGSILNTADFEICNNHYKGKMDVCSLYDYVLTEQEILSIWNSGLGSENPICWIPATP